MGTLVHMEKAKPEPGSIKKIAQCWNCDEQLVWVVGAGWTHSYSGKVAC